MDTRDYPQSASQAFALQLQTKPGVIAWAARKLRRDLYDGAAIVPLTGETRAYKPTSRAVNYTCVDHRAFRRYELIKDIFAHSPLRAVEMSIGFPVGTHKRYRDLVETCYNVDDVLVRWCEGPLGYADADPGRV